MHNIVGLPSLLGSETHVEQRLRLLTFLQNVSSEEKLWVEKPQVFSLKYISESWDATTRLPLHLLHLQTSLTSYFSYSTRNSVSLYLQYSSIRISKERASALVFPLRFSCIDITFFYLQDRWLEKMRDWRRKSQSVFRTTRSFFFEHHHQSQEWLYRLPVASSGAVFYLFFLSWQDYLTCLLCLSNQDHDYDDDEADGKGFKDCQRTRSIPNPKLPSKERERRCLSAYRSFCTFYDEGFLQHDFSRDFNNFSDRNNRIFFQQKTNPKILFVQLCFLKDSSTKNLSVCLPLTCSFFVLVHWFLFLGSFVLRKRYSCFLSFPV